MTRITIFLIVVALIVGLVGCVGGDGDNGGESYTLTIDSTAGGTITVDNVPIPGRSAFTYDTGAVVSLIAAPSAGYRFVEWTGNASTIADTNHASTTITMNGNYSITANFIAQYVLTIDSTDGGHVTSPGEGTFAYDAGTVVNLVAEAEEGYKFLNWTGDIDPIVNVTAASTMIIIEGDCTFTANFLPKYVYLDRIGPGLWGVGIGGQGIAATVTEEGVVVNITSNPVDNPEAEPEPSFGAGGYCTYLLKGDFDARMAYELVAWPQGSGVRVGMSVGIPGIPDKFTNVERDGRGRNDFPGWPREVYSVNWGHSVYGTISTDDLSGTLRICREGGTVTCYCSTLVGWHELYKAEWLIEDVYIWVSTWSHESLFGGKAVSVLMRTVEFVEPAP